MRKYEDLSCIHDNTLKPRAHYVPYDSLEKALEGDRSKSKFYTLLNGEWDFRYFSRDIDCPKEIDTWDKVCVPSCWQSTGYENPYYTNVNYQYPLRPPYVPDDNPVGVYRKLINVSKNSAESENYIVFEGVCSCFELFVNGEYIGFSSVSHCTSEFKVNLSDGENEIIAKVYKWCAGSYLEDQDFFRYNGIFRDVYLLSRNKGHLHDIYVGFDDKNIYCDKKYTVYDADKKRTNLENPILWNAEKPYLYTVVVEEAGEYIPFKIGMRSQRVRDRGELLINGVSVKLKGVNHHDSHPFDGYAMSREFMRDELLKMKGLNINAIRTSHYPPQPYFLELCDELGFYVIDEADIETHGMANYESHDKFEKYMAWQCHNKEWRGAFLDRAERLYERDKNHTCVIMWSLGNESEYGENFAAMSDYIRSRQNALDGINRLIHYEQAYDYENPFARSLIEKDPDTVDVVSRMYADVKDVVNYYYQTRDTRPFIWCEYCHAMGNGPGDLADYWRVIDNTPYMIGAFIWEWADHAAPDKNGRMCYGGDFGEETHDANFCCDGLVFHDRSFKAGSFEAKAVYQPIKTELNGNRLTVYNKYDFTNLSELDFEWNVCADGKIIRQGRIYPDAAPHYSDAIELDFEIPKCRLGAYLNVSMKNKEGGEIAFTQHLLSKAAISVPKVKGAEITRNGEFAVIEGDGFRYIFNTHYGYIEDLNGLIKSPMRLSVWRAPTDNDRIVKDKWYGAQYDKVHNKAYSVDIKDNVIKVHGALAPIARSEFFDYTAEYSFYDDGRIDIVLDGAFDKSRLYLPRLGFEFTTDERIFEYFGYGPYESYIDMHHGSKMGMYKSSAGDEYVDYIMPQEHGNHYNTKYLRLGNFEFVSAQGAEINVSEYSAKELERKAHNFELEKDGLVHVRIDYKVSGIGSNSCGPELCECYRMNDSNVHFELSIFGKKNER